MTVRHIVKTEQFEPDFLFDLFKSADNLQKNPEKYRDSLSGTVVATLFYEPSTRTRLSFESAVNWLGGSVISTENAKEFSSATKGETLEDSIKVISSYCDAIVLRHFEDDSSARAISVSSVPIINAGSGKVEHPTQALLDAYTIWRKYGKLENLNVGIVGDLFHGRTCDSLVHILSKFSGNIIYFVSPENCRIKDELRMYLEKNKIKFEELNSLDDMLPKVDVLYMTRVQKERFDSEEEYKKAKGSFILDKKKVNKMKKDAIVMHPLPRVDEITQDVDGDERAVYFEQAENGLWIRMALLNFLINS